MEAKLSSVRIMSAASLATSVPVTPMATPMSAFLRAGASFTTVAGDGHDLAHLLQGGDHAQLLLGGHAGEHHLAGELLFELGVVHVGELEARHHAEVVALHDAQAAGDARGGEAVVAR